MGDLFAGYIVFRVLEYFIKHIFYSYINGK